MLRTATASLRPGLNKGDDDHVQSHCKRPRVRPRPCLCRDDGGHDARRFVGMRPLRVSPRQKQNPPAGRPPVAHAGKGVTDTVLAAIDLEKEPANIKERQLRFRKLTIEPGGIVPWHSHADRPAIIYIAEGEIAEYASNCADPIVHKAGDIRPGPSRTPD